MGIFEELEGYASPLQAENKKTEQVPTDPQQEYIEKIKAEGFNMSEMEPILRTQGSQLIISGAGSGKTTVLTFQIQNDILTGEATKVINLPNGSPVRVVDNILVCTFTKAATVQLKERLGYWQRKMGYNTTENIQFKTLDKEFQDVLRYAGCKVTIIDEDVARNMLKSVCEKYLIVNKDTGYMSNEDYKAVDSIITYARNVLDNTRYMHPDCDIYGLTCTILDSMLYEMKTRRREMGVLDFGDVQEILYSGLQNNKSLRDYIASKYAIIYIDEFQDTSQIQYEILKYYFAGVKKVVAIGDDDQTIYTWRGSDINIIVKHFPRDYKPTIQKLTTNFRCPSEILNPVIPSICTNKNRHNKELKPFNKGGELNIISDRQVLNMAHRMLDSIIEDMKQGYTVAILTRTNYDGMIPAFLIDMQRKFNYTISSLLMTASTPLPRSIMELTSIFTDRCSPRLRKALDMVTSKKNRFEVGELYNALKNTGNMNIWNIPLNDLRYSIPELGELMRMLREVREGNGDIEAFKRLLNYVKFYNFNGDSEYCNGARNFIDFLMIVLEEREFTDVEDFNEYFRHINKSVSSHLGTRQDVRINICTVNEAKGLEWDSVYIWNDSQGVFPNVNARGDLEEERRLHYIAWTRPRKKLTVTTITGNESLFLLECDIPKEKINPTIRIRL